MIHLRFTPDDISGYTFDFLDSLCSRYIIAREILDKSGQTVPEHFHILIDTDYGDKHVRDEIKKNLKIPPVGKGRNNKHYALQHDWKDPSYICKYDDVIKSKGFSDKEILDYALAGKNKYLSKKCVEDKAVVSPQKEKASEVRKVPFQQAVIASAAALWYNYKRENPDDIQPSMVVEFVCKAMREESKGINAYLVKDLAYAVLYDDLDYRDWVVARVKNVFDK